MTEFGFVPLTKEDADLFYQARKIEGQLIALHPYAAEVWWKYARTVDPYNLHGEPPEDLNQIGREYFAALPQVTRAVSFHDIPAETRKILRERLKIETPDIHGRIAPRIQREGPPAGTYTAPLDDCIFVDATDLRPPQELLEIIKKSRN
jgi:hypothetical protein